MLTIFTFSTDCNVTEVAIDDVSVDNNIVKAKFSSNPNARFRCRLNNQHFRACEWVINVIGMTIVGYGVMHNLLYFAFYQVKAL